MKKYWQIFKLQLQWALEFKWSVILYRLSNLFSLMAIVAVWYASKSYGSDIGGFSMNQLITYYVAGMVISGFVYWTPTGIIKDEISEGTINTRTLLKPVSYYWQKFFGELGWHIISPLFNIFPVILAIVFLRANLIADFSITTILPVILTCILAAFVCFNLSYCFGLAAFWFTEVSEVASLMWMGLFIFGGQAIPISFFPEWIRGVINILPFRYMFSFPLEIYLGRLNNLEIVFGILAQILWIATFSTLANFLWKRGVKRYSAFGG